VPPSHPPAPLELLAVRLPGTWVAPKVRALIDFLCKRFGDERREAPLPARGLREGTTSNARNATAIGPA
jgi:hypothetical protein